MLLKREEELENIILQSDNPILMAVKLAMIGNYIDFGALSNVDESQLNQMLLDGEKVNVDAEEFKKFCDELLTCKSLVYLTDNCGEIVLDKLLIKTLKREFPEVEITVIVRGGYVLNDATMEDAIQVGISNLVRTIDNGNSIAGTWLPSLSESAKEVIDNADIIVAKGQANYETLRYCGMNIYYLFLCKCEMLAKDFGVPRLTGMFANDKRRCRVEG